MLYGRVGLEISDLMESHDLVIVKPKLAILSVRLLFMKTRPLGRMRYAQEMRYSAEAIFIWITHQRLPIRILPSQS